MSDFRNSMGKALQIIGILFLIAGIVVSLIVAKNEESIFIGLIGVGSSLFLGMILLGLSEVIFILEEIESNTSQCDRKIEKIIEN